MKYYIRKWLYVGVVGVRSEWPGACVVGASVGRVCRVSVAWRSRGGRVAVTARSASCARRPCPRAEISLVVRSRRCVLMLLVLKKKINKLLTILKYYIETSLGIYFLGAHDH